MSIRRDLDRIEKRMDAEGRTTHVFIRYAEREIPGDRMVVDVDTSDESARRADDGSMRYLIGDTWHTAAELASMNIAPVVITFGRQVPAPDSLQPSPTPSN